MRCRGDDGSRHRIVYRRRRGGPVRCADAADAHHASDASHPFLSIKFERTGQWKFWWCLCLFCVNAPGPVCWFVCWFCLCFVLFLWLWLCCCVFWVWFWLFCWLVVWWPWACLS